MVAISAGGKNTYSSLPSGTSRIYFPSLLWSQAKCGTCSVSQAESRGDVCLFQRKLSQPVTCHLLDHLAAVMVETHFKRKPPSSWAWVTVMSRSQEPADTGHETWIENKRSIMSCHSERWVVRYHDTHWPDLSTWVEEGTGKIWKPAHEKSDAPALQEVVWPLLKRVWKAAQQPWYDKAEGSHCHPLPPWLT